MASDFFILVARILLAIMFLSSGYAALSDVESTAGYFASLGLEPSSLFAWGVGLFELASGILLVSGFQTRPTAAVLTLFTIAASFLGHYGQGDDDPFAAFMHRQALVKDVAVAGGLILLTVLGAGRLSIDAWRGDSPRAGDRP